MNYNFLNLFKHLSSILNSSPVANTPLEVGLWVSLDEGVYWSYSSLGSVIGRSRVWGSIACVTSHSHQRLI